MFEAFTERARRVIELANQEALQLNHPSIGTEHLLLALLTENGGGAATVLGNLRIDARKLYLEIKRLKPIEPMYSVGKLKQTPRAAKSIEYAIDESRGLNHGHVGTEHILLGLLRVQEGLAAHVLMRHGLTIDDTREEVKLISIQDDQRKSFDWADHNPNSAA
jgi:ATP-dependent Clp protease ATP-binding subunit ClpC